MATNNFKVHTDANYRIRGDMAKVMQSSRYFNTNNCMNSKNLNRNIISNQTVNPYTVKFDDGSCDYGIARDSELKIGSHRYNMNRPQNYENQLNLSHSDMKQISATSKMDQAYNLTGPKPPALSGKSADYYPYAYGNNLTGVGDGVMGGFVQHPGNRGADSSPGDYETYKYRKSKNYNQNLVQGGSGVSNFNQFKPNRTFPEGKPVRGDYSNKAGLQANYNKAFVNTPDGGNAYVQVAGATTSPSGTIKRSNRYVEPYQARPNSNGFFFDPHENYISSVYGSTQPANYGNVIYVDEDGVTKGDMGTSTGHVGGANPWSSPRSDSEYINNLVEQYNIIKTRRDNAKALLDRCELGTCPREDRTTTTDLKTDGQCLPSQASLQGQSQAEQRRLTVEASGFITSDSCTGSNVVWQEGETLTDAAGNTIRQDVVLTPYLDAAGQNGKTARCEPGTATDLTVIEQASSKNNSKVECEGSADDRNGRVYYPSGVEAAYLNAQRELQSIKNLINTLSPGTIQ